MPDTIDDTSRRRAVRDSLFMAIDLLAQDRSPIGPARVRNLSATGLMADCPYALLDGERLVVILRGIGEVAATISWIAHGRIGLAFDRPIDPKAARRPVMSAPPLQTGRTFSAPLRPGSR
ncbi:MAG: PilZ domain-containing protein [Sphingobium sp.]